MRLLRASSWLGRRVHGVRYELCVLRLEPCPLPLPPSLPSVRPGTMPHAGCSSLVCLVPLCADCSQPCRTSSVRTSLTQTKASIRSRGADGTAPQSDLPHIGQTIATPIALPLGIEAPSHKRQRSVPSDLECSIGIHAPPSPRAIECRGAGCARLRLRPPSCF